ncbi:MAG: nucleotidyl transferase AbiEii/AbiGii toxin family protein [Lentimicrobiaceae bacterium]|nr:nucleotidyl transferase AbiEii/AbiGii toxin family protein [Lentimicrobiaceae bacterium]
MILHQNNNLFRQAVQVTAEELQMAPEFVEKDYWICQILQNLSRHRYAEKIVWKGGTSLSKAYGIIKRFSSDVDFAILAEGLSQNQQKKLITRIGHDITEELTEMDMVETIKNNRFRKTFHSYESVIRQRNSRYNFLGNHVTVEINTYGNPYPYVQRSVHSFIAEMMERRERTDMLKEMDMAPFIINVLDKRRTLCEKVVSLLRFSFEDDPVKGLVSKVRHFYDLYYLMKDEACRDYLKTDFRAELAALIAHDKESFDRPPLWRTSELSSSVLLAGFDTVWDKVAPVYLTEVGALSYGEIPEPNEVADVLKGLMREVQEVL